MSAPFAPYESLDDFDHDARQHRLTGCPPATMRDRFPDVDAKLAHLDTELSSAEIVGFPPFEVQPAEVQTPTKNEPDRPDPAATGTGFDDQRWVRAFENLDDAMLDQRQRGECVLFDLHAMWWTVPMELNIHQINAMIRTRLAELEVKPLYFHLGAVYQPRFDPTVDHADDDPSGKPRRFVR